MTTATMPLATAEPRYTKLPITSIDPSPWNTRTFHKDDPDLLSLGLNIKAIGVKQPILVRPAPATGKKSTDGRYQLVSGERRWRASKLAGLQFIPALVEELTDDQAREITVVENLQRQDLTPLEASRGVQILLEAGQDLRTIADHLGRPVSWVSRCARLQNLSDQWRLLLEDKELVGWTISHWELIARLEQPAQDEFLNTHQTWHLDGLSLKELERDLVDYTHQLTKAPWKLDDALLLAQAGACVNCPKRSSRNPGLFDDQDPDDAESVTKNDRCLDVLCWQQKSAAHVATKKAKLKEAHPELVMLNMASHDAVNRDAKLQTVVAGETTFQHWDGHRCKKTEKGARPALIVAGPGAGSLTYFKPHSWKEPAKASRDRKGAGSDGKPEPGPSLKERRKQHLRRRQARAVEMIKEAVQDTQNVPTLNAMIALSVVFGTAHKYDLVGHSYNVIGQDDGDKQIDRAFKALLADNVADAKARGYHSPLWVRWLAVWNCQDGNLVARALWIRLRPVLLARLNYQGSHTDTDNLLEEAYHVAELVGLDGHSFLLKAYEAIPEPKSWKSLPDYKPEPPPPPPPPKPSTPTGVQVPTADTTEATAAPSKPNKKARAAPTPPVDDRPSPAGGRGVGGEGGSNPDAASTDPRVGPRERLILTALAQGEMTTNMLDRELFAGTDTADPLLRKLAQSVGGQVALVFGSTVRLDDGREEKVWRLTPYGQELLAAGEDPTDGVLVGVEVVDEPPAAPGVDVATLNATERQLLTKIAKLPHGIQNPSDPPRVLNQLKKRGLLFSRVADGKTTWGLTPEGRAALKADFTEDVIATVAANDAAPPADRPLVSPEDKVLLFLARASSATVYSATVEQIDRACFPELNGNCRALLDRMKARDLIFDLKHSADGKVHWHLNKNGQARVVELGAGAIEARAGDVVASPEPSAPPAPKPQRKPARKRRPVEVADHA